MKITVAGEDVLLLPQKALFWVKAEILVVADLHLGKAAAFRSAGIPIPEGDMQKDLKRLSLLLHEHKAKRCIIVGDLLHHPSGMKEPTVTLLDEWIAQLPFSLDLVLGNHDFALKKVPHAHWNMQIHPEQLHIAPFVFAHHPTVSDQGYVLSGHLHPQAAFKIGNRALRFPCFYFQEQCAILPAFSSFAGGCTIDKAAGQAYVCLGDKVVVT